MAHVIAAAIMSLLFSALGVATPALFPLVPASAASSGFNPMFLFVVIVVGAQASAISPLSLVGSFLREGRIELFPQLLLRAVPIGYCATLLLAIVLTFILQETIVSVTEDLLWNIIDIHISTRW
jgi:hypothetical protein